LKSVEEGVAMKTNKLLRIAVLLFVLTVPSFAFLQTTMARYTTQASHTRQANVAAFEVRSTPTNFGTNRMVYFHRRTRSHLGTATNHYTMHVDFEPYSGQHFRIDVTNTSQVSVRMRPEFFHVLHDNATTVTTAPGTRGQIPHQPIHRAWTPNSPSDHLEPRIVNVRSFPVRTAAQGNYGGANHHADGVYVAPGDTVRFYWDLQVHTYRHANSDLLGLANQYWDGAFGNAQGWLNGAFRITYNIIAVQVDYVA